MTYIPELTLSDWAPRREAAAFAALIERSLFTIAEAVETIEMTPKQRDILKRHKFVPPCVADQLFERRMETIRLLLERQKQGEREFLAPRVNLER
jgi:hypothetical protein